jgi:hypothetical protein
MSRTASIRAVPQEAGGSAPPAPPTGQEQGGGETIGLTSAMGW